MKKGLYLLMVCFIAGIAMWSCKNKQANTDDVIVAEETIVVSDSLNPQFLDGEWVIITLNGDSLPGNLTPAPFLGFNSGQNQVYGNSGCNALTGVFEWDSTKNGSIAFEQIASTRMACPNNTIEQPMLSAMNNVDSFDILACDSSTCVVGLYNGPDSLLMVIQKMPAMNTTAPATPATKK